MTGLRHAVLVSRGMRPGDSRLVATKPTNNGSPGTWGSTSGPAQPVRQRRRRRRPRTPTAARSSSCRAAPGRYAGTADREQAWRDAILVAAPPRSAAGSPSSQPDHGATGGRAPHSPDNAHSRHWVCGNTRPGSPGHTFDITDPAAVLSHGGTPAPLTGRCTPVPLGTRTKHWRLRQPPSAH